MRELSVLHAGPQFGLLSLSDLRESGERIAPELAGQANLVPD